MSIVVRVVRWVVLALMLCTLFLFETGCDTNACYRYFTELKTRCRLDSTSEGAKLDEFLKRPFSQCQIALCEKVSVNEIDCGDADTHIPGGMNGRFSDCKD